jgi:hypothetical protein
MAEGVWVHFVETSQSAANRPDPEHPKAEALIYEAFRQARVRVNGGGGGMSQTATENELTILIGSRRMDDCELTARQRELQTLQREIDEQQD